jgi:hypothetical protein
MPVLFAVHMSNENIGIEKAILYLKYVTVVRTKFDSFKK